jgi:hypothetical protein
MVGHGCEKRGGSYLAHPSVYVLMYGDPHPGVTSAAAEAGLRILREHIHRIAVAGRLKISDERAIALVHASACGVVLTLLAVPENRRDLDLRAIARDSTIAATTTDMPVEAPSPATAAVTLRALLPDATRLTDCERALMNEWLERLAER